MHQIEKLARVGFHPFTLTSAGVGVFLPPFHRVARGTNTLLGQSFLDQQNGWTNDLGIIVQTHLSVRYLEMGNVVQHIT